MEDCQVGLSGNIGKPQCSGNIAGIKELSDIYRFLALSMRYPTTDWLNKDYFAALYVLLEGLGWHGDIYTLKDPLLRVADIIETLQIEYTRLFINAVPHVIAPPYGSVYVPGEGTVMNRSTELIRAFYRQHGFELAPGTEIADHIVCELEFLSLLAESGKSADEEIFLHEFFRSSFVKFHNRVIEGADHHFYRVVIRLIDFFTKEED
ncbi:MAG: molecular chaperone TorD family protein [Proteobacteria bacterium]|nr:molecular chaperone TorD family protein [Pseudomonadota bacterium]MBU1714020.1 molecular chaperone TorD family protein [Pseudomonadota bacterium]